MIAQHHVQMCHIQWSKQWWEHNTSPKRIETSTSPPFQSGSCFHGSVTCWAEVGFLSETRLPQGLHCLSLWLKCAPSENKRSSSSSSWRIKVMRCEDLVQIESEHAHHLVILFYRQTEQKNQSNTKSLSNSLPDSPRAAKRETVTRDKNL